MATDAETVAAAVRELRVRAPVTNLGSYVSQDIPFDAMAGLTDRLIAEEGLEAIVAALAPHRDDADVAEALFFMCWTNNRDMSDVFSDEEVVEAALEFLLAFQGEDVDIRNVPGWGWSALFQHIDYGRNDHLTDEAHFRMLLKLIEKVPLNDNILFMIGDGPLSHAAGKRKYRDRIVELQTTNPKVERAWWLNLVDGVDDEGRPNRPLRDDQ
jgi:hypothetical protein